MEFTHIKYAVERKIATITLGRPEMHNAFNEQLVVELSQAFAQAQKDAAAMAIILRAEGDSFCSGTDPAYLEKISGFEFDQNLKDSSELMKLFQQIYTLRKPVIALVQGATLAEGCGLVTVCDFVIAAGETARFGFTEVNSGFVPAVVLLFLVRRLGEGRAREFVLRGNILNAKQALDLGLVSRIVPSIELDAEGISLAMELIGKNSASAMGLIKELLSRSHGMSASDALEYAMNLNALSRMTDDGKRGTATRSGNKQA
jgi:methylglutaconyl-CoA hydratase